MRKAWTYEERCFLKANYNVIPIEELEKKLDRTRSSITSQVNYLKKRKWTFKNAT